MAFNVNNRDNALKAFAFYTAREIQRAMLQRQQSVTANDIRHAFDLQSPHQLQEEIANEIEQQAAKLCR